MTLFSALASRPAPADPSTSSPSPLPFALYHLRSPLINSEPSLIFTTQTALKTFNAVSAKLHPAHSNCSEHHCLLHPRDFTSLLCSSTSTTITLPPSPVFQPVKKQVPPPTNQAHTSHRRAVNHVRRLLETLAISKDQPRHPRSWSLSGQAPFLQYQKRHPSCSFKGNSDRQAAVRCHVFRHRETVSTFGSVATQEIHKTADPTHRLLDRLSPRYPKFRKRQTIAALLDIDNIVNTTL